MMIWQATDDVTTVTDLVAGRIRLNLKTAAEKLQRRIRRFGETPPPEPKSPVRAPFRNLIFDQVSSHR
jgi:hypothetical protein